MRIKLLYEYRGYVCRNYYYVGEAAPGLPFVFTNTNIKIPLPEGNGPESYLRSNELDNSHFSSVTTAWSDLYDLSITAVSVSVLWSDLVEELLRYIFLGYV